MTDPAPTSPRQPAGRPALQEFRTALNALYLEVEPSIANDIVRLANAAIAEAEAASLPVQQAHHSDEIWIRRIEHGEQPIRWGVYFGSECAWDFPENERHMAYSLADNLGRILRLNTYDESSDFSASLRSTSLVPEGFPESRVNSPHSFPRAAIGEKGTAPSTPPASSATGEITKFDGDMFWDWDDPEQNIDDLDEYLYENRSAGDIVRIQQAERLPDIWGFWTAAKPGAHTDDVECHYFRSEAEAKLDASSHNTTEGK